MANLTSGFASPQQLSNHFQWHGGDFGVVTEGDYETLADEFLGAVIKPPVQECSRVHGDIVRFDSGTDYFGVRSVSGIIRTFFKPVPCATLPPHQQAAIQAVKGCAT